MKEPKNISELKLELTYYIKSGKYLKDVNKICKEGIKYINALQVKENDIAIFDVDDTCLSSVQYYLKYDFSYSAGRYLKYCKQNVLPAIPVVLDLYQACLKKGLDIYILTARFVQEKEITELNLNKSGYDNYKQIIMRKINIPSSEYKLRKKKALTNLGKHIIINVGDQISDGIGNYEDKFVKIPNPFYKII